MNFKPMNEFFRMLADSAAMRARLTADWHRDRGDEFLANVGDDLSLHLEAVADKGLFAGQGYAADCLEALNYEAVCYAFSHPERVSVAASAVFEVIDSRLRKALG